MSLPVASPYTVDQLLNPANLHELEDAGEWFFGPSEEAEVYHHGGQTEEAAVAEAVAYYGEDHEGFWLGYGRPTNPLCALDAERLDEQMANDFDQLRWMDESLLSHWATPAKPYGDLDADLTQRLRRAFAEFIVDNNLSLPFSITPVKHVPGGSK